MKERLEPNEIIAIQKQWAMKPKVLGITKREVHFVCPFCQYDRYYVINRMYRPKHCEDCGQKLDWSEENGKRTV